MPKEAAKIIKQKFRVLFLPVDSNPYQQLLAKELSLHGITIVLDEEWAEKSLSELVNEHKIDIVHLHWLDPLIMIKGKVAFLRSLFKSASFFLQLRKLYHQHFPIMWTIHNLTNHEQKHVWLETLIGKQLAKFSRRVFVHNKAAILPACERYGIKENYCAVTPHGNYIGYYPEHSSREEARCSLGFPSEAKVLLFAGHIRRYKGVLELLDAFKQLAPNDGYLLIAGKPFTEALRQEILNASKGCENIHLRLSFIPEDDMHILMQAADGVVLPLKEVTTSGSAILASSYAKALVAPDYPAIREAVDNVGEKLLYNPKPTETKDRKANNENGLLIALQHFFQLSHQDFAYYGTCNLTKIQQLLWSDAANILNDDYRRCLK